MVLHYFGHCFRYLITNAISSCFSPCNYNSIGPTSRNEQMVLHLVYDSFADYARIPLNFCSIDKTVCNCWC